MATIELWQALYLLIYLPNYLSMTKMIMYASPCQDRTHMMAMAGLQLPLYLSYLSIYD